MALEGMLYMLDHSFYLRIDECNNGETRISVSAPGSGEARDKVVFVMPQGGGVAWAGEKTSDLTSLGTSLYDSLFRGKIKTAWDESRGAAKNQEAILRLRIRFDPSTSDLAHFNQHRWEYLYRSDTGSFLALQDGISITRYLEVPRACRRGDPPPILGILAVAANPKGAPRLKTAEEYGELKQALASVPEVELDLLDHATAPRLQEALAAGRYQVIHFMGHGNYDPRTGWGGLLLQDAAGNQAPLSGHNLRSFFDHRVPPALVVLNSCNTAYTSPKPEQQVAYAAVACGLVSVGIPAVIAMQDEISDQAARAFSRGLYSSLRVDTPIDQAVQAGRLAVHALDPKSPEWGFPVLFLRSPDGLLFDPKPTAPKLAGTHVKAGHIGTANLAVETITQGIPASEIGKIRTTLSSKKRPSERRVEADTVDTLNFATNIYQK